ALERLIPRSVRGLSRGYYDDAQIESAIRFVFGPDTQLIADGTYFVVVTASDSIVGCGGWSRRRTLYGGDQMKSGADPLVDPATEPGRIRAFFVDPDWSRRGIGSKLMNACVDAARAGGFHTLELAATLPGVPLYRAFGFRELEQVTAPTPDGVGLPIVRMS